MKMEKKISLHAFEVEYIDQREAKPRRAGSGSSMPSRAIPWQLSTRATA